MKEFRQIISKMIDHPYKTMIVASVLSASVIKVIRKTRKK